MSLNPEKRAIYAAAITLGLPSLYLCADGVEGFRQASDLGAISATMEVLDSDTPGEQPPFCTDARLAAETSQDTSDMLAQCDGYWGTRVDQIAGDTRGDGAASIALGLAGLGFTSLLVYVGRRDFSYEEQDLAD